MLWFAEDNQKCVTFFSIEDWSCENNEKQHMKKSTLTLKYLNHNYKGSYTVSHISLNGNYALCVCYESSLTISTLMWVFKAMAQLPQCHNAPNGRSLYHTFTPFYLSHHLENYCSVICHTNCTKEHVYKCKKFTCLYYNP